jgi:hypothetical protein
MSIKYYKPLIAGPLIIDRRHARAGGHPAKTRACCDTPSDQTPA